jgi:hypothetical protein
MYGQTNCFVLPEGVYGAYSWANGDVLIVSERGARGLAHQGYAKDWGKVRQIRCTKHFLISPWCAYSIKKAVTPVLYDLSSATVCRHHACGVVRTLLLVSELTTH